jgi:hypothetical protein
MVLGTRDGDVILLNAPSVDVPDADPYCVSVGARILEAILEKLGAVPHSPVCLDDAWASAVVGARSEVVVTVTRVPAEAGDESTWALQFAGRRGCVGFLLRRNRSLSPAALAVREAVFAAAQAASETSNVRWIDAAEFERIC